MDNDRDKLINVLRSSVVSDSKYKVLMGDYYEVVLALDEREYDLFKRVLYGKSYNTNRKD